MNSRAQRLELRYGDGEFLAAINLSLALCVIGRLAGNYAAGRSGVLWKYVGTQGVAEILRSSV